MVYYFIEAQLILTDVDDMSSIILRIAEYYKGNSSRSGSSFLVERVAANYCPVIDNANYVGRCPAV